MTCSEDLRLSVYGCMKTVKSISGAVIEESFDWTNAIADAGILAALAFFGALAGTSILEVEFVKSLGAAAITAGAEFFGTLAIKRNLTKKYEVKVPDASTS